MSQSKKFTSVVARQKSRVFVPLPFDPNLVWGKKGRHLVRGTVGKSGVRGAVQDIGGGFGLVLGPAWLRDCGVNVGDTVEVVLEPEGPQRADLAPDVAKALEAEPEAGAFFDSLAQFYRKGFLSWIDATKRSPEVRQERIGQMVELLKAGKKERPGR